MRKLEQGGLITSSYVQLFYSISFLFRFTLDSTSNNLTNTHINTHFNKQLNPYSLMAHQRISRSLNFNHLYDFFSFQRRSGNPDLLFVNLDITPMILLNLTPPKPLAICKSSSNSHISQFTPIHWTLWFVD
jgi:hypothetical protein